MHNAATGCAQQMVAFSCCSAAGPLHGPLSSVMPSEPATSEQQQPSLPKGSPNKLQLPSLKFLIGPIRLNLLKMILQRLCDKNRRVFDTLTRRNPLQ